MKNQANLRIKFICKYLLVYAFLFFPFFTFCNIYNLSNDPIDVIILCAKKDIEILDLCIQGIKNNGKNIRNIIVISEKPFTDQALWFDENNFPFSKESLANEIFQDDINGKNNFLYGKRERAGWLFQQLLKLYASFVIPNISKNILVLDADIIFLNPVQFMNEKNEPLFAYSNEYNKYYFEIAQKLLPYFHRVDDKLSGVTHHMIFQRDILESLFSEIIKYTNEEPWKAICHNINKRFIYGAFFSEYELYFNYVFLTSNQGNIRFLKFKNIHSYKKLDHYQRNNFSFVSIHSYFRRL